MIERIVVPWVLLLSVGCSGGLKAAASLDVTGRGRSSEPAAASEPSESTDAASASGGDAGAASGDGKRDASKPFDPQEIAVTKRFTDVKAADSYELTKIARALERIDASMLVELKTDKAKWAPTYREDEYGFWGGETPPACQGDLGALGAGVTRAAGTSRFYLSTEKCRESKVDVEKLAAGTLGVVWGKNPKDWLVFVTLDGGRYTTAGDNVRPAKLSGALPPASIAHVLVRFRDKDLTTSADADVAAAAKQEKEIGDKWSKCADPIWDAADKKYGANANILDAAARQKANDKITDGANKQEDASCGKLRGQYEAIFVGFAKKRTDDRKKIHEQVSGRLAAKK